jgi:hypothetical protein
MRRVSEAQQACTATHGLVKDLDELDALLVDRQSAGRLEDAFERTRECSACATRHNAMEDGAEKKGQRSRDRDAL